MTYQQARSSIPSDAMWSSSFGNPGEGGFVEYFRAADGSRFTISNGSYDAIAPFTWTTKALT